MVNEEIFGGLKLAVAKGESLKQAMISFYNADLKTRKSFVGLKSMKEMNSQIEQKLFNDENPAEIYLEPVKKTKGFLFWKEEIILFSVEYKSVP